MRSAESAATGTRSSISSVTSSGTFRAHGDTVDERALAAPASARPAGRRRTACACFGIAASFRTSVVGHEPVPFGPHVHAPRGPISTDAPRSRRPIVNNEHRAQQGDAKPGTASRDLSRTAPSPRLQLRAMNSSPNLQMSPAPIVMTMSPGCTIDSRKAGTAFLSGT